MITTIMRRIEKLETEAKWKAGELEELRRRLDAIFWRFEEKSREEDELPPGASCGPERRNRAQRMREVDYVEQCLNRALGAVGQWRREESRREKSDD